MGAFSGDGFKPGYNPALLLKAQEEAAKAADVTGSPFDWLPGMDEETARITLKMKGFQFRVARRQGMPTICTRDYLPVRYNVDVDENGIITEVLGRG